MASSTGRGCALISFNASEGGILDLKLGGLVWSAGAALNSSVAVSGSSAMGSSIGRGCALILSNGREGGILDLKLGVFVLTAGAALGSSVVVSGSSAMGSSIGRGCALISFNGREGGILDLKLGGFVLRTGAAWSSLPAVSGSGSFNRSTETGLSSALTSALIWSKGKMDGCIDLKVSERARGEEEIRKTQRERDSARDSVWASDQDSLEV